jgi:tight adherence protein B
MEYALLTFGICVGVIVGAYWLLVAEPEAAEAKRLDQRLKQGIAGKSSLVVGVASNEAKVSGIPILERLLKSNAGFTSSVERLIAEAGMTMPVGVFLGLSFVSAAAGWTIGLVVLGYFVTAIVLALLGAVVPLFVVRFKRNKRLSTFEEQFPEAVDLIARSLRAGHAFTTGLGIAAEEMPAPVSKEFKQVYDQQNFGMSLPDALRSMALRVPVLDARFFVTAVLTQRESGGNLAEVLNNLSSVMRERFKVKRQIRVISAHGRLSAWILCLLPPTLATFITLLSPKALEPLFNDPMGQNLVILALVLQIIGTWIISRLVRIEY